MTSSRTICRGTGRFRSISSGILSETVSFLRVFTGNSWNTPLGIIDLGRLLPKWRTRTMPYSIALETETQVHQSHARIRSDFVASSDPIRSVVGFVNLGANAVVKRL
ncbi:hypothetical protein I4U23_010609 [Adineta vaga]|nr:hypothetical protein I4U23_010609 [Adineta vaga]